MRIVITTLLVSFFVLTESIIYAQIEEISKPHLELKNDQIFISYQIHNSTSNDRYKIWLEVTDTNEEPLNATALVGDYGKNVPGGGIRQIIWNYRLDNVSIEEGVYIQVLGERMPPEISTESYTGTEQSTEIQTSNYKSDFPLSEPATEHVSKRNISTAGAMLRSLAFPGWGLARATGVEAHFLKGIVAYSGIASALIFNNLAYNNFKEYENSNNESELDDLFNESIRQDNISEFSAYAAIGIWVLDVIWTVAGLSGSGNIYSGKDTNIRLNMGATLDPGSGVPMLALHINFTPKNIY